MKLSLPGKSWRKWPVLARIVPIGMILLALAAPAFGLTPFQQKMARYADQLGGPILAAIIGQESSYCTALVGDHGTAFGCGHVHLPAARRVLGYTPSVYLLTHDYRYGILVSYGYYSFCLAKTHDMLRALVCYNQSLPLAESLSEAAILRMPYVKAVLRRLDAPIPSS